MFKTMTKGLVSALLIAMPVFLSGCGDLADSPTNPQPEQNQTSLSRTAPAGMGGMIVFTPKALTAAKQALVEGDDILWAIDTDFFEVDTGGDLEVVFPDADLKKTLANTSVTLPDEIAAVNKAKFTFYEESIGVDEDLSPSEQPQPVKGQYEIGMAASSGQTLEDISVVFGPSGLLFTPTATIELDVTASPGVLQEGTMVGYHISHGGEVVTKIEIVVTQVEENRFKLVTDVPGFSRYDYGDESGNHDNEGCGHWPLPPCG